jgi:hypothetical protein
LAANEKLIVTAFHNIYDEFPHDYDQSPDSTGDFSFLETCNTVSKESFVSPILKNAIILHIVIKKGDKAQEEFLPLVLLR